MSEENNGFLDADQTFGNYYIRELGGTFAQLQDADPSLMLRQWWKMRKAAQGTSIGTTILGGAALAGGVMIGAPLLLGAGAIVGLGSGFLAWHHNKGASAHQLESEILDNCPMLIPLLVKLEQSQMQRSELIAAYDSFMKAAIAGHIDATNQNQIKGWFQARIEQRAAFVQAATGFAQTQNDTPIVPALSDAPVEDGSEKKAELTLPQCDGLPQSQPAGDRNSRESSPIATPATPQPSSPIGYLIGDRLRTALIVSVSGGGKDILLSNALREFQKVYPAFRVVVADCKDDPKEYGYYDGLPNVSIHRLNVAIASDGEVIQWVDEWVTEFNYLPEQALLICNEGTLIRKKSQRYVDAVGGLVSSGDSRQKFAWEAGQSAHTKALKMDGDERSRFRLLLIGLKSEEMQVEAILQAQCVADSARNMNDIKAQMMRSPVSRAWCDGQAWYAMPKLENYSGYDRDSRSMLAGFVAPQPQNLRDRLEGLYRETTETKSVPDAEIVPTNGDDKDEIETNLGTSETTQPQGFEPFDVEAVTKFVSSLGTKETTLFEAILQGFRDGLSPSDIVKDSLKLKKQYQEGRSLSVYLVRKYGGFDLFQHFRKWLEE